MIQKLLFILLFTNFLTASTDLKKVTIQLSWFDQFQFAGYYIAKEKGFYKDLGLDVTIKPFEFGIDIPKEVSEGTYNFAVGRETLILDKANDKNIVALYALFQSSPLVLLSTKESGINSIKDFEGKKIMTTIDDASEVSIKSMITSQKLNISDLNFIKHTHNINDLVNKNTDVISAYTSKSPYHLNKMGIEYNMFAPKDYGFDMYSDLLYTSEDMIKNDLDTVIKFKEASLKGWKYAYDNQLETANLIFNKYNSQKLSINELLFEAKELEKLSFYNTEELGNINLSKLQRIYDLYNIMGLVPNQINIKEFVYIENSFSEFIKKVFKDLSKYIELPYIYFFIGLFLFLIFSIIYKQIQLYRTTRVLKYKEKRLKKVNTKLKDISQKDHLTKLYNRRYFDVIAKEYLSLAKRENKDISILLLDIDNFKIINDTYGHEVGDIVICELAKVMNEHKRESDVVSRVGGEEFTIILPNTSLEGAKHFSEKLRNSIEEHLIIFNDRSLKVTVSMGLTIFKNRDNLSAALKRADIGLYESKNNGKNKLTIIK